MLLTTSGSSSTTRMVCLGRIGDGRPRSRPAQTLCDGFRETSATDRRLLKGRTAMPEGSRPGLWTLCRAPPADATGGGMSEGIADSLEIVGQLGGGPSV